MPDRTVHLQFRRFAECPICNLHVRELARRNAEIESAGITEIVVFHSSADRLREYQADLPFAVVGDPERNLYKEFGVEWSWRSLFYLDAARAALRGLRQATSLIGAVTAKGESPRQTSRFPDRARRHRPRLQVRRSRGRPMVGRRDARSRGRETSNVNSLRKICSGISQRMHARRSRLTRASTAFASCRGCSA